MRKAARQAMNRKQKVSSNWRQAKSHVQRTHASAGYARRDLRKASITIRKNDAVVSVEKLQTRNIHKSAAGSSETPGRNVRAQPGQMPAHSPC